MIEDCDPARPVPASTPGHLALVSYVEEPLKSKIQDIRRTIPGSRLPEPHITVLPPRPTSFPVEPTLRELAQRLQTRGVLHVELADVRTFAETSFLYMAISSGAAELHHLHASLNSGALFHPEQFDFRPHVTLAGPVPSSMLAAALVTANEAWRSASAPHHIRIDELVCLWRPASTHETRDWIRLCSFKLGEVKKTSSARGT